MCPNGRAQPRLTCDLAQIVEHVLCARISTIEYVQRLKFRYPQTTSNESRRPAPGRKCGPAPGQSSACRAAGEAHVVVAGR